MPRKEKVKRCCDSTCEKVQHEALNSELHGSTGQPDREGNITDRSFSKEQASQQKISKFASISPKQIQEPSWSDTEHNTVGESKRSCSEDTSAKSYMPIEKATVKPDKTLSKADVGTSEQLTETEARDKSDGKIMKTTTEVQQSSSHLLKWSNKQPKTQAKGKKKKEKKRDEKQSRQTEVSDYFAVRRSDRKCKSAIENEKQKALEQALLSGKDEDLEVREVEGKGRGVFAKRNFTRGQFVCEYAGELIDYKTAKEREKFYEGKTEFGCYMYYFSFRNKKFCVDATQESGRLGRLLNHSKTEANCATRLVCVQDTPRLILETVRQVTAGQEMLYDYGERSKDVIQFHQWLKS